ncbi:MAG: DUF4116 domain-containing protein, partial [Clostridia bacterium]|nr:DUF4116 domain-containing protein [Clostridia bacterium]
ALQVVAENYSIYNDLPNKLKSDKEIVLLIMKLNDKFRYIPENLSADKEVALATIRDGSWWGFNYIKSDLREEIEKELDEIKKFSNGQIKLAELSDNLFLYDVYVNKIKKAVVNVLYNAFKDKVETEDVDIKHAMDKKIATVGKIIDDRCREAKAKKEKEIGDYEV